MPTEDKFKDLFNDPNLQNEDWLEGGPELLKSITDEIYTKRNKRNKIIIFAITGFISIISLIYFLSNTSKTEVPSSELITNNNAYSDNIKTTQNILIKKETLSIDKVNSLNQEKTSINNSNSKAFPSEHLPKKTIFTNKESNTNLNSSYTRNRELKEILESEKGSIKRVPIVQDDYGIVNKRILLTIQSLNRKSKFLLSNDSQKLELFKSYDISSFVDLNNIEQKIWSLNILSGISFASLILNDNYKSDLNPFDFSHDSGTGFFIQLKGTKSITNKFSFNLGTAYESLTFNSGHNSEIIYSLDEENGLNNNTKELGMATPLGFINSEIVIERLASDLENETNLVIDLQNKHQLHLLEISGTGEFTLINKKQLSISPSIGFGASYLIGVKNQLKSINSENNNFFYADSRIIADQTNINKLTPFLDLGLILDYRLKKGISIGAIYRNKKNLQPIFEQAAYNSTLNRQNIALFFGIRF